MDPAKEAAAQAARLANNTTTLADEWAARGEDWRDKLRQRAEEKRAATELGLTEPDADAVNAACFALANQPDEPRRHANAQ